MENIESITSRLDNLSFSRWHLLLVVGIGTVWFFDGYQVSLIVQLSKYILDKYSETQYKQLATFYQIGCIIGSVTFGIFSYYRGRRIVFMTTLLIYIVGIALTVIPGSFFLFGIGRLLTGISVGGQFTAVFTAIDQFLPPKIRGRVNIMVDGSWHLGGAFAAILNLIVGQVAFWKGFFILGGIGATGLFCIRYTIPESPRWLISKGRINEADNIVTDIVRKVTLEKDNSIISDNDDQDAGKIQSNRQQVNGKIQQEENISQLGSNGFNRSQTQLLYDTLVVLGDRYKSRLFISCLLIFSQAFFINYVFYSYPLVLKKQYNFNQTQINSYLLPISICAFVSTVFLGPFFDIFGRKMMLLITYSTSGILLALVSIIHMPAIYLQILVVFMFIFASPASSSANLIASEIFPTQCRTILLSFIFILSMVGAICGVWVKIWWIVVGLMVVSGILGWFLCPKAENKSLEEINRMKQ